MFKCLRVLELLIVALIVELTSSQAPNSIEAILGWNASFSIWLTRSPNNVEILFIKSNQDRVLMFMSAMGVTYTSLYKERIEPTASINGRSVVFILRNITLLDAGRYTAVIENSPTLGEQTLIVKASPQKPQIVEVTPAISGSNYILRCSTVSNSAPPGHGLIMMSEWKRNGELITTGDRYTVQGVDLTITSLTFGQVNGVRFTCAAYEDPQAKSTESDEHLVDVKYGPTNVQIIGVSTVKEGDKLNLTCSGDCNPQCNSYEWRKDFQLPSLGSFQSLVITNISRELAGIYMCSVTNTAISKNATAQVTVTVNCIYLCEPKALRCMKGIS